ncbi:MAG: rod shape-determining protein MreD [Gammaproteobacteria bacterium]|nr:rod shape-determining protein MreD [Gammaproteobacteria bacterium]
MTKHVFRNYWFIYVSLFVALVLDMLPLPEGVAWIRPQWVLLVLIYWMIVLPHFVGIFTAFSMGIILDLVEGSVLGEHGIAMIIIAYLIAKWHQRIQTFSLIQQSLVIASLIFIYQFIIFVIQKILGLPLNTYLYWVSFVISAVLWPWCFILLQDFSRRLHIN